VHVNAFDFSMLLARTPPGLSRILGLRLSIDEQAEFARGVSLSPGFEECGPKAYPEHCLIVPLYQPIHTALLLFLSPHWQIGCGLQFVVDDGSIGDCRS